MNWIKLDRSTIESKVFAHETALKIWVWCLCKASHKSRHFPLRVGQGSVVVSLKVGQFVFGRNKAAEELNIKASTIYNWMQKFESEEYGLIKIESNKQFSIVTVCKYDVSEETKIGLKQPPDNHLTGTEQLVDSIVTAVEHIQDLNTLETFKIVESEETPTNSFDHAKKTDEIKTVGEEQNDSSAKEQGTKKETIHTVVPGNPTNAFQHKSGDEWLKVCIESETQRHILVRTMRSKYPTFTQNQMTMMLDGCAAKFDIRFPSGSLLKDFLNTWTYYVMDSKSLPNLSAPEQKNISPKSNYKSFPSS